MAEPVFAVKRSYHHYMQLQRIYSPPTSIRLPEDLTAAIRTAANAEYRTVTAEINVLLREALAARRRAALL